MTTEPSDTACIFCGQPGNGEDTTLTGKPLCDRCAIPYCSGKCDYAISNLPEC
jgi:hypothetical protein